MAHDEKPSEASTERTRAEQTEVLTGLIAQLTATVVNGFRSVKADMDLLSGEFNLMKTEHRAMQRWQHTADERFRRHSDAKQLGSATDLSHDAKISREIIARQELAMKVDDLVDKQDTQLAILVRLDKITSNPIVKTIATILATAITTWAATRGFIK